MTHNVGGTEGTDSVGGEESVENTHRSALRGKRHHVVGGGGEGGKGVGGG